MTESAIKERFDFYWAHRSQRNMGWIVELWPGWHVKWSGWSPLLAKTEDHWDAEWVAIPLTAGGAAIDPDRSKITIPATAIVGQHAHEDRMVICLEAFAALCGEVDKQESPTVGLRQQ